MRIQVVLDEVTKFPCDLLVLKNAAGFHGVDRIVGRMLGYSTPVDAGQVRVVSSTGALPAKQIAFVGVGPLNSFRYAEIRSFGQAVIQLVAEQRLVQQVHELALTSHGAGTGLDEAEAFRALIAGITDAATSTTDKNALPWLVTIVEINQHRARLFQRLLEEIAPNSDGQGNSVETNAIHADRIESAGSGSDKQPKLFAAMPFDEKYLDEYQIAFLEAANANGFLCERLDLATYVGDVLTEIKTRIANCSGVLALMNDANANVFLEIGYAWAKEKPTLLLLRRGQEAPFDVQGHRYIEYATISELRTRLTSEVAELKRQGVLK